VPELPEVENVRMSLQELVAGKTISRVDVRLPRIVRSPDDKEQFQFMLQGCVIEAVNRRGKYLLFDVGPYTLVSHLRMEGQYKLADAGEEELPHTHVVFYFEDGTELRYRDVRQFGTMDLIPMGGNYPKGLQELGPEPFDERFTATELFHKLRKRSSPIKAVLLDQTCVAGLGNIYVDESLFLAGIHPEAPASALNRKQVEALHTGIRYVLSRAIEAGGTSIRTYVNGYGRHGEFQIELNVYSREGQACRKCGTPIEKSRVAGRGTHVCPKCQRRPRHSKRGTAKTTGTGQHRVEGTGVES
jgi:formamidopyrimidine-DNA glycosylase